ncbi:hypothetical protein J6590_104236, partial [Homalodisca vitripennis]
CKSPPTPDTRPTIWPAPSALSGFHFPQVPVLHGKHIQEVWGARGTAKSTCAIFVTTLV